ncbi:hypothetical protein KAH55_08575, partial [bacterium]|nr:hypothetical protein [bacterium]
IYRDDPRIEISLDLNWQQKQQVMKFCLPVNLTGTSCRTQQPYGQFERLADGEEHPFQRWIDVVGQIGETEYGVAVLNDG